MTEYETFNFDWCVDCLMMAANGEGVCDGTLPDGSLCEGDERCPDQVHAAAMDEQWPAADGWHTSSNCREDCEGWFSSSRCDGCGSTLGGDRHPAVAMREIK